MTGKIEMKKCCSECGFPIDIPREPIFIKNGVSDLIHVAMNTCEECGHQKNGSTIPVVHENIQRLIRIQFVRRDLVIDFFEKFIRLSEEQRKDVAVYYQNKEGEVKRPYSWNVIALELTQKTRLGFELLEEIRIGKNI